MGKPEKWEWISTRQLADDTVKLLLPKLPHDVQGVVGVARSGMMPATILATHLHLPLYTINQHEGPPYPLGTGVRGNAPNGGRLLVVDDTVYSGNAVRTLRDRLKGENVLFGAVYVHPERQTSVDVYGRVLPSPHLLEWNIFNSFVTTGKVRNPAMQGGIAVDFDGVLTTDEGQGKPLYLPRRSPVPLVITGRAEKLRQHSLEWLARWGVSVARLEMRPETVGTDNESIARWKADIFKRSPQSLFIESDPSQAKLIAELSGKPVACPGTETIYRSFQPEKSVEVLTDPVNLKMNKVSDQRKSGCCGKGKRDIRGANPSLNSAATPNG